MTKATELRELASLTTISSGQIQFDTDIKISGDLITTGNTITITADTLNISDPNITLASGSANSSVADGAGITVDLGTDGSATFTYESNTDVFAFNKHFKDGTLVDRTLNIVDQDYYTGNYPWRLQDQGGSFQIYYYNAPNMFTIKDNGNTGLGTDNPVAKLHIQGTNSTNGGIRIHNNGGNPYSIWSNQDKLFFSQGDGATTAIAIEYGGNVGIKNDNPTVMFEVGKLESGNTGLAIFNSEGGNEVGVKVQSRTNRATLQVADNDTSAFVQAEDGHAIYGQHSNLASADMTIDTDGNMNLKNGSYYVDQVRHDIRPTLNLDFANSKQLDPRITFHRSSYGTYHDSKGILRVANHNEPRFDHDPVTKESKGLLIEENRTNLIKDLSNWNTSSSAYFIRNTHDTIAPDGTYSAVKVIRGPSASYQTFNTVQSMTSGVQYTFSWYGKENSSNPGKWFVQFNVNGWQNITFYSSQFPYNTSTQRTTDVGNGWYRFEWTFTSLGTGQPTFTFHPHSNATAAGEYEDHQYYWGVQLEEGSFATSYIPPNATFSTRSSSASYYNEEGLITFAPENTPRYGYTSPYATEHWGLVGTTKTKLNSYTPGRTTETGLIVEDGRTNLENYSYNMDTTNHGQYVSAGGSFGITRDVKAPDGSYTASKFVFAAANDRMDDQHGSHNQSTYTFSMWVKGQAGTIVGMAILNELGGNVEPYIYLTGDWQRISVTKTFDSQGTNIRTHGVIIRGTPGASTTSNDGRSGTWASYVYVWGMQVENGFTSTSYIPTYGGTATRSADVVASNTYAREKEYVKVLDENFDNNVDIEEGTVFVDVDVEGYNSGQNYLFAIGNTTGAMTMLVDSGQWIGSQWNTSNNGGIVPNTDSVKSAVRYSLSQGQYSHAVNGVLSSGYTGYSTNINYDARQLNISGDADNQTPALNAWYKKFAYYHEALTTDEIKALTENN